MKENKTTSQTKIQQTKKREKHMKEEGEHEWGSAFAAR